MTEHRSSTRAIIQALRILAEDIQSGDGVANAVIAEAADRLEELVAVAEAAEAFVSNETAANNAVKRLRTLQSALRAAGYIKEAQE